ncbi:SAM-dependent methyltransferase [Pseudovibrio ascidiaceicola]|uniref:SAM-dependent methyltransferase n=1 Tax=Pseudovibrio ascidiaceicola TaxID=285279 RepID=UPI003D36F881
MTGELIYIGHIETPYFDVEDCPNNIQPEGPECKVILKQDYWAGLKGLQPGQAIMLLYWFENTQRSLIQQKGCRHSTDDLIGSFALRSPHRPNPIAVSQLPILSIGDGVITVRGLDCLNETKLLDIKPAILQETARPKP